MPRTILLVDGDQYLHRACAATERSTRWDDENHVLLSNEVEAYDTVVASLNHIMDQFANKDMVLTFSEGRCFRYDIDPTYKSNRAPARKPLCFHDVRRKLIETYRSVRLPGLEADDVMGILATKPGPDTKIIIARDKDMKTIPGKLWDGSTFHVITEAGADYYHMYQTLVGDAADGYKGCPGIGPKKAEAILTPSDFQIATGIPTSWEKVVIAYKKAGLTEEHALTQARLARILRWSDWDSVNKQPILWSPQ